MTVLFGYRETVLGGHSDLVSHKLDNTNPRVGSKENAPIKSDEVHCINIDLDEDLMESIPENSSADDDPHSRRPLLDPSTSPENIQRNPIDDHKTSWLEATVNFMFSCSIIIRSWFFVGLKRSKSDSSEEGRELRFPRDVFYSAALRV